MSKNDGGSIFLDSIIALFILTITLTSVYSLVIRSIELEQRMVQYLEETVDIYGL